MQVRLWWYRWQARRRAADHRPVRAVPPGLAAVLVLVVVVLGWTRGWLGPVGLDAPRALLRIDGRLVLVPAPVPGGVRAAPAVAVTGSGPHAFLHTQTDGSPVGYDPCRPVHFVVRPDHAPASGDALLADAVVRIQAATGLVLVDDGPTSEAPSEDRAVVQRRYGAGWAPVLVVWSDPVESPVLAGDVGGIGGSSVVPAAHGGRTYLAAGSLVLDAADLERILVGPDGYPRARAVVLHELGHVVGLDHVDAPGELMAPSTGTTTTLGPGDREGLALVGQVPCDGA